MAKYKVDDTQMRRVEYMRKVERMSVPEIADMLGLNRYTLACKLSQWRKSKREDKAR